MSRTLQVSVGESDVVSTAESRTLVAVPTLGRDNPLQLLREAITRLNSSNGEIPDEAQMAGLLTEVREALERANVVARVAAQCEEFIRDAQFDKAFQSLDAGFLAYPADPALVARRSDLEDKQRAFQSAETVRRVLEEAQWFLHHNRLDLAAGFLKEKTAEFPHEPTLILRLEEIEALLPQWEQDRQMQAALGRVAALEEVQQSQMALTVIEEALQSYSASEELTDTARRTRARLADRERQNRLARRLELIGQKIAAQSWMPALALLENTATEFPGTPKLKALRREVDAGLKRSQCEAIVTEVRQCLTDGEPDQAEQALRRGMESLGQEPALAALREEVESERKYREELRTAQVLFGRRQLLEAERVLAAMAGQDRIEAQLLLDTVRQARAVTDEENFCERGREKALTLMQQQQFAQAADLLRNLCSLFPGNPILERDLQAAQGALEKGSSLEAAGAAAEENNEPQGSPAPAPARLRVKIRTGRARTGAGDSGTDRVTPPSRVWRSAVAGTAALVLVSAGGAAWKFSQNGPPISRPTAPPVTRLPVAASLPAAPETGNPGATQPIATQQLVSPRPPAPQPTAPQPPAQKPPATSNAATAREITQTQPPPARVLRSFVPPAVKQTPVQSTVVPLPPESAGTVSAEMVASLPAELVQPINISAPVLAAPAQSAAPVAASSPKPPLPASRNVEEPQLIDRWMPAYPELARKRGIFGVVRLEATINEQGTVKHVKVVNGDPVLVAAATSAVMTWKYKAATLNGRPVPSIATIEVSFRDPAKK